MFKKSNDVLCVSLSDSIFKAVLVKQAVSGISLSQVVSLNIEGMAEASISKTIQSSLGKLKVKSAQLVCVIPPSMTTTKNIEIPSNNPEEIKSIVNLQAGRHTPFSREEIQIGYVNIGVYNSNYTKVLLVIANKSIIRKQLTVFEKAGLKIKKFLFAPEGVAAFYSQSLHLDGNVVPTGVIDIGKESTDFVIIFHGLPITSRSIPIGRSQIEAEGSGAVEKLAEELKTTIDSYQSEDIDQLPANYVLTSDDEKNQMVSSVLTEKLGWSVQTAPYVDNVRASKKALQSIGAEYADVSFLDVVTAVSAADKAQVNFMPEEVQIQKNIEVQSREVFKAAIYGFIMLILVMTAFGTKYYFTKSFLSKLKSEYMDNRKEVVALEKISTQTMLLQNYLQSRMVSLDTIYELYANIPNEVYLTTITMNKEGHISIQGISDIASLVFNLGTTLKESELFKSVDIKSTTSKKDRGKDATAFEITLKLYSATEDSSSEVAEQPEGEK